MENNRENRNLAARWDELTGSLIGLARACTTNPRDEITDRALVEGLVGSIYRGEGDEERFGALIPLVHQAKEHAAPGCAMCTARCGNTNDYEMERMWNGPEKVRTIKTLLLCSLRQMAAMVWPVMRNGDKISEEILDFFYRALFILAEDWEPEYLLSSVMEAGRINLLCMEYSEDGKEERA